MSWIQTERFGTIANSVGYGVDRLGKAEHGASTARRTDSYCRSHRMNGSLFCLLENFTPIPPSCVAHFRDTRRQQPPRGSSMPDLTTNLTKTTYSRIKSSVDAKVGTEEIEPADSTT